MLKTCLKRKGGISGPLNTRSTIGYVEDGNFTTCAIITPRKDGSVDISLGTAKRNPVDRHDPRVGRNVAFYRAISPDRP